MSGEKYIGLDVHQATICAAVMDPMGKVIIECSVGDGVAFTRQLRGTHGYRSPSVHAQYDALGDPQRRIASLTRWA
jgi:hypothetical protein